MVPEEACCCLLLPLHVQTRAAAEYTSPGTTLHEMQLQACCVTRLAAHIRNRAPPKMWQRMWGVGETTDLSPQHLHTTVLDIAKAYFAPPTGHGA